MTGARRGGSARFEALRGPGRQARWQRARLRRIAAAALVAVAVCAAWGLLRPAPEATVAVTVAARPIAAGAKISAADLRTAQWPSSVAVPGVLPLSTAAGRTATAAIAAGEPVTQSRATRSTWGVLRADAPLDGDAKHVPLGGTSQFASSPDSEALRTIARLFTNASSSAAGVGSDVRDLPIKARRGLLRSTSAMRTAGWDIAGQIRQRGLGSTEVAFTQAGAALLGSELKNYNYDSERGWAIGTIDGFRRSLGSLYLTPSGTKTPLAVNVSDPDTLAAAARLAAEEGVVVQVQIETVRALSSEESTRMTTSRSLLQIERAAESLPYPE